MERNVRRYTWQSAYRFPEEMRYSWETESYVVETEADTRDRDTPSPFELRLNDDTPSSPDSRGRVGNAKRRPRGRTEEREREIFCDEGTV